MTPLEVARNRAGQNVLQAVMLGPAIGAIVNADRKGARGVEYVPCQLIMRESTDIKATLRQSPEPSSLPGGSRR